MEHFAIRHKKSGTIFKQFNNPIEAELEIRCSDNPNSFEVVVKYEKSNIWETYQD